MFVPIEVCRRRRQPTFRSLTKASRKHFDVSTETSFIFDRAIDMITSGLGAASLLFPISVETDLGRSRRRVCQSLRSASYMRHDRVANSIADKYCIPVLLRAESKS